MALKKRYLYQEKNLALHYFSKYQPHLNAAINHYTLKLTERLSKVLSLERKDKILEIGCGSGRFTLPLVKKGLNITGIDLSEELVALFKKEKIKAKIILGDINKLHKSTDKKFNKIIGFFILHHLDNIERSLAEIKKVSSSKSKVGFIEPNPLNILYYIQPFISKNMTWNDEKGFLKMTPKRLEKIFIKMGYKNFSITKFGFFPPFVVNHPLGLVLDNFFEKKSLFKPFLPFQLITATTN